MKKIIWGKISLLIILLLVSCNEKLKREYYENGELKAEYETRNGINHGYWKEYDSLGNLLMETQFQENVLNGPHKRFYDNKQIEEEYLYVNGLLQGSYKKYYRNGITKETGACIDDTLHGEISTYDSLGNLATRQTVCHGILCGTYQEFYSNGKLSGQATYGKDGVLEGQYKEYYQNGKVKEEGTNVNGKANGLITEYDSLGNVLKVTNYFEKK